jgi:hypothetical protein
MLRFCFVLRGRTAITCLFISAALHGFAPAIFPVLIKDYVAIVLFAGVALAFDTYSCSMSYIGLTGVCPTTNQIYLFAAVRNWSNVMRPS